MNKNGFNKKSVETKFVHLQPWAGLIRHIFASTNKVFSVDHGSLVAFDHPSSSQKHVSRTWESCPLSIVLLEDHILLLLLLFFFFFCHVKDSYVCLCHVVQSGTFGGINDPGTKNLTVQSNIF